MKLAENSMTVVCLAGAPVNGALMYVQHQQHLRLVRNSNSWTLAQTY